MSREIASDAAARVMLAPSAAAVSSLVPLAAIMTNRYIIAFLDFCMTERVMLSYRIMCPSVTSIIQTVLEY